MKRRDFLKNTALAGVGIVVGPSLLRSSSIDLAVVKGDDPAAITKKALDMLGGIGKFISKGDRVIVKPNIGWDRVPELAANTNPDVVKTIVELALNAGAKSVLVMDNTCNDARRCYVRSGIKDAAEKGGAEVKYVDDRDLKNIKVGGGVLKSWPVYRDYLEADKIINVPIAKHHSLSLVTLGMKNWFGAVGGRRRLLHQSVHQSVVDMDNFFKPALTILDAYRVRTKNGPQGTNPADVRLDKTVIAGVNSLAVDVYGATLFGHKPEEIPYLRIASGGNSSKLDLSKYSVSKVSI